MGGLSWWGWIVAGFFFGCGFAGGQAVFHAALDALHGKDKG